MILEQTAARQTKLLSLLRREFGLSAGLVKRLKWQNALFVNGAPAHTDCPVQPGDHVRVVLEEQTEGFSEVIDAVVSPACLEEGLKPHATIT